MKKRQKAQKFITILLFFLIIFIFFGVFYVFTKIDFVNALNMNKYLIFEEKTYYALSLYSGEKEDVLPKQNFVKANGGAGFVYKSNAKYYMIANVYKTEKDANTVAEKLIEYQPVIITFKLDRLVLSTEYSTEQIKTLKHVLNQVNRAVENLSEIVSSFDYGEILESEAKQKLQIFATSCQQDKESLSNAFPSCCDNIIAYAKIFCNQTVSCVTATELSTNFSGDAKNLIVKILTDFMDFQKNIKKKV